MDYPPKGNLLYPPISLHSPSQKLKGRRIKRKKKDRKKERKRERISFEFFQLILPFFSLKKKKRGKKIEYTLTPISPSFPFPKHEKREKRREKKEKKRKKRNKKKEKKRRKRRALSSSFPVHIFLKKEKEEETKEKILIQKWKFERNVER